MKGQKNDKLAGDWICGVQTDRAVKIKLLRYNTGVILRSLG